MSVRPKQEARPLNQLLKMAVIAGVESAVQIHVRRGDDLNARDEKGMTPLMLAAARNKAGICRLLLAAQVDARLLNPSGKDALEIARASDAHDAAKVLETALLVTPKPEIISYAVNEALPRLAVETTRPIALTDRAVAQEPLPGSDVADDEGGLPEIQPLLHRPLVHGEVSVVSVAVDGSHQPVPTVVEGPVPTLLGGEGPFYLFEWEAEKDQPPPEEDATLALAALATHIAISAHIPIDPSADWEDFDAFLPEQATPLLLGQDAESRAELRRLLLRVIREGSVPDFSVEDVSLGEDRTKSQDEESLLRLVINDLGAETDERFEYSTYFENFEVFVNPEESPDEEEAASDALAFLDDLASHRNDPLRHYLREMQRERMITADEEVDLAKAMENGLGRALDALVEWPSGIERVLAAAELVRIGAKPLEWLSTDLRGEPSTDGSQGREEATFDPADPHDDGDDDTPVDSGEDTVATDIRAFLDKVAELSSIQLSSSEVGHQRSDARDALASLRIARSFLIELAQTAVHDDSEPALRYAHAMSAHERAHERMTLANLRLVLSIAKRYLGSGIPFEDLIQEGNLGLRKAVARFDWRLGYKFSTYATWWIRQQITRSIANDCRTIRLPVHVHEAINRIKREVDTLERATGRRASVFELASRLSMQPHKIEILIRAALELVPIQQTDIDGSIPAESIEDPNCPDPFEAVAAQHLRRTLDAMLSELDDKPAQVLRLRFGLDGSDGRTLEETGKVFKVTRERIRQIEAQALKRLRHPLRSARLHPWLYDTDLELQSASDAQSDDEEAEPRPSASAPRAHGKALSALKNRGNHGRHD